ncbi:MAG: orotidine-5'-phosphate decarboxylase [Spirochaetales bacterium]|nr:orotidine-5'-phosphate decarboxylase [Spirochaetales bacterium]
MSRNYCKKLRESAVESRSIVSMGLDPILEYLPAKTGDIRKDLSGFYHEIFTEMVDRKILPGAFKPNIGYFHTLDRPRNGDFSGSLALADLLAALEKIFPGIPVILDAKRGDIALSSSNYANEAFVCWGVDAVTISPYMGTDSAVPFMAFGKGVYILNRTSNPGAADFQDLTVSGESLFHAVAEQIIRWAQEFPGTGAVVGATSPDELSSLAEMFAGKEIPLLIPGVGSQGGSGSETVARLRQAGYDPLLARINSSSGITHPWKKTPPPTRWAKAVVDNLENLNRETGGAF